MPQFKYPKALVLVVSVYIVAALSVLAFALAFRSRMAVKESMLLIERIQQDKIAHAACVQARGMLAVDDDSIDCLDEPWAGGHELVPSRRTDQSINAEESDWEANWRLIDESSKINVNLAYPGLLLGLECIDEAAVASILDWIDQDDIPNPDGAENDYYAGLTPGHKCKNGPIDNIEELLLIEGISPQIYYGSNIDGKNDGPAEIDNVSTNFTDVDSQNSSVGLSDLLTIYGDGRININTASKAVLDTIPLLSDEAVSEIISRQKSATGKFSSMDDIENNDNFAAADKLSLMQTAKFNSNHFQLQIKVRRKGQQFWSEYLAIIERKASGTRLLSWQRKSRTLLKDEIIFAAYINKSPYPQGLEQ